MMMRRVRNINHNRMMVHGIALILVASVASIVGCVGAGDMSYLTDTRYPPKPESAPIAIFPGDPGRPYVVIGQVTAMADVPFFTMPDAQTAINKIKALARKMGGDAIIRYSGYRAPVGTQGAGGFTAQGTVVRWK